MICIIIICHASYFSKNIENGPDRSGMVPDHSRTLLRHCWTNMWCWEHTHNMQKNMKRRREEKNIVFFPEVKNKRVATMLILTVRRAPHLSSGPHSWKKHKIYINGPNKAQIIEWAQQGPNGGMGGNLIGNFMIYVFRRFSVKNVIL